MRKIVFKLANALKDLVGEEFTLVELISHVYNVNINTHFRLDGLYIDEGDLNTINFMLIKEAHRQGYKLDYSNEEYDGCVGMLCYIPFTIKKYTAVKKSLESKFNNR